jgi:vancomycin resistance protein VanJ
LSRATKKPFWRQFALGSVAAGVWATFAVCLASWGLLRSADHFWLGTLIAFGPKWPLLLPIGILAPIAACFRRRSLWVLAAAVLVVLGPIMGFVVPWTGLGPEKEPRESFCILTCNVEGKQNLDQLWQRIDALRPDIVTLQEYPGDAEPPLRASEGWYLARRGHLLLASRFPIMSSEGVSSPQEPWRDLALRCRLQTTAGKMEVCCVHLMTPRSGIQAVLHARLAGITELNAVNRQRGEEAELVSRFVQEGDGPLLLAGDFNMPVESQIYRKYWGKNENAFSTCGWGWGFTKYTRWHGVRIDQMVAVEGVKFSHCHVGGDVGSDHRPVIAIVTVPAP